jgi:hypothetical protein
MRFWILSIIGGVLLGGYEAIMLRDDWFLGSEYVFRASGAVTAFAIIGVVVGLVFALAVLPEKSK